MFIQDCLQFMSTPKTPKVCESLAGSISKKLVNEVFSKRPPEMLASLTSRLHTALWCLPSPNSICELQNESFLIWHPSSQSANVCFNQGIYTYVCWCMFVDKCIAVCAMPKRKCRSKYDSERYEKQNNIVLAKGITRKSVIPREEKLNIVNVF